MNVNIREIYGEIVDMAGNDWFMMGYPAEEEIEYIFTKSIKPPDWSHDGYYVHFTLEWKLDGDEVIRAYHDYDHCSEKSIFNVYAPYLDGVTVRDIYSLVELVNYFLKKECEKE